MKLFDRLAQDNRNVAVRLLDSIKDFISKVKSTFSGDKAKADTAAKEKYGARVEELERATYLWEKMLSDTGTAVASGNINTAGTDADGGRIYSLKSFEDGRRFVDVETDQNLFDGLTDNEKGRMATKIIKERFAGKVVGSDNRVFVNGRSATECGHPSKKLDAPEQNAKMRASTELDNLIDAGTNFRTAPDGADGHIHPKATGDFKYFDTIFKVGNEYFEGRINILPNAKGDRLIDVTRIKNITQDICSSYGENPKSTFLRDNSEDVPSSDISISETAPNVNRRNSLKTEDLLSPDYGKGETSAEHQDDRGNSSSVAKIPPPSSDGPPPFRAREAKDADGSYIEDTGGTARDDGETVQNDGNVIQYTHEEADGIRKDSQTFRNVIEGIDITLSEFFSKWKSGRKNGEKLEKLYLGKASESVKKKISDLLGYEIPNRDFIITNDAVKHVHDEHGDIQKEEGLGQIVVNEETISTIVETLNNPDSVTKEFRKKEPRIVFKKKTNAGDVIAVEVDNKGRATLSLKTVYIKKGQESTQRGDFPEDTRANLLTSETTVPNSSDNVTIPQESGNVKGNGTHTMYREYENHQVISILKYHLVILLSSI